LPGSTITFVCTPHQGLLAVRSDLRVLEGKRPHIMSNWLRDLQVSYLLLYPHTASFV
jgi:hypothetical protein